MIIEKTKKLSDDNYVYLVFCEIATCKRWIRDAITIDKYIENYDNAIKYLSTLSQMEQYYNFRDPVPSQQIQDLKSQFEENTNKFIMRSWDSLMNKICNNSRETQITKVNDFIENAMVYKKSLHPSAIELLSSLGEQIKHVDAKVLRVKKPQKQLDTERESEALRTLVACGCDNMQIHYALINLISLYSGVRQVDERYDLISLALCYYDLIIANKIKDRYDHINFSLKKLTILYAHRKEYEKAIEICNIAIKKLRNESLKKDFEDRRKRYVRVLSNKLK